MAKSQNGLTYLLVWDKDVFSPSLFNLYMEFVMKGVQNLGSGIQMVNMSINNVRYADDTTLMENASLSQMNDENTLIIYCMFNSLFIIVFLILYLSYSIFYVVWQAPDIYRHTGRSLQ